MSDTAFVSGRSRERARLLLAVAEELGHPVDVVRTVNGGYNVPVDVAEAAREREGQAEVETVEMTTAEIAEAAAPDADDSAEVAEPAGNASKDAWIEYAITRGYDPSRGLTRDELKSEYGQG